MHKRLLGALVGIALLMTLCLNVLAAYSGHSARDKAALESAPITSAADLLNVAYETLNAETESQERVIPNLTVNGSPFTDQIIFKASGNIYVSIRAIIEILEPDAHIAWANNQFVASGAGFHLTARPDEWILLLYCRGSLLAVPYYHRGEQKPTYAWKGCRRHGYRKSSGESALSRFHLWRYF